MMAWDQFNDVVKKAVIAKKNMENKGIIRAKAQCPYCTGFWYIRLIKGSGSRGDNIHLKCDGDCKTMMMT